MLDLNLGQSRFQDTYFVSGAQLTPYRRLRQIDLELRSIEQALHNCHIAERKLALKLKSLNPENEGDKIEIDDAEFQRKQQSQLIVDAIRRQLNFQQLRAELLASVPQEYWDRGFEAAEAEHWPAHFAQQIGTAMALGLPPPSHVMDQVLLLPTDLQRNCILMAQGKAQQLMLTYGPPPKAEALT